MIRIVLLGRTGNHLFQYALGRVLAKQHGVPLLLDGSWFNTKGWAEVSHFLRLPIQAKVIRRMPIASRALRRFTGKHYWQYRHIPILRENPIDQSFDRAFLEAPRDCLLFGYFQTPLYFESIATDLRHEFRTLFREAFELEFAKNPGNLSSLLDSLKEPESVAVHVRRTDYLTQPAFQVCGWTYYQSAMEHLRARISGARFFIFSDDPDWCRLHFTGPDHEVVEYKRRNRNPLLDLHLMSTASHHIIANSTYSWWAAWLAARQGQQVIMPDRWYARDINAPIGEKRLPGWDILPA